MSVVLQVRAAPTARAWLAAHGAPRATRAMGSAQPLVLAGDGAAWLVVRGSLAVYAAQRGDAAHGERQYLFTAEAGEALFGFAPAPDDDGFELLAVAAAEAELCPVALDELLNAQGGPPDAASLVDLWLERVCRALGEGQRTAAPMVAEQALAELRLAPGERVCAVAGAPWLELLEGRLHWLGDDTLPVTPAGAWLALAGRLWALAAEAVQARRHTSQELLRAGRLAEALRQLLPCVRRALHAQQRARRQDAATALLERERGDAAALRRACAGLAGLLSPRHARAGFETSVGLLAACRRVCVASGVAFALRAESHVKPASLAGLADAARLRLRRVALEGEWWQRDAGALLAFQGEQRRPVALVWSGRAYALHDPAHATPVRVTRDVAAQIAPSAYMFYRRLPPVALRAWDLLRFGLAGHGRELVLLALLGLGVGLLGMALPLAIGWVFDALIPGAERVQLLHVVGGLAVSALAVSLLEITRSFSLLRLEGRLGCALQAAVWDRLVDLPAGFFRSFTAGDLADRAFGVDTIRHDLSSSVVTLLLTTLFGGANVVLLFALEPRLAASALLLLALAGATAAFTAWRLLRLQTEATALQGRLSGLVVQLVRGLGKLRCAAAEARAFGRWADLFRVQRALALRTRAPLQVFSACSPLLALFVLYALVLQRPLSERLSAGVFVAFAAAFGTVLHAQLQASASLLAVLQIVPTFERLRPILDTPPECDTARNDPGELDGDLELAHVSFSYAGDTPPVLRDVSLHVRPGEFVALVGASGSGKSTLLRLLLGFERPSAGHVYYSGQDLNHLELRQVRRQIGVVLQNSQLLPGDILSNVQGASNVGREAVLEALRLAHLEQDVAALPMGVYTVVSEGGSTLSGGQRQRLLIARALLHRPRLLLFDEATSALDNESQAAVSASLAQLDATRVVVAHRLSTIQRADRIVVLDHGRIVQTGRYTELLHQPGTFAELARRQLL